MILHSSYLLIKYQYLFVKNMSSQQQIWSSNLDNAYDQGKKTSLNCLSWCELITVYLHNVVLKASEMTLSYWTSMVFLHKIQQLCLPGKSSNQ